MPTFYVSSGSIDKLEVSSSLVVSGSLIISGSLTTQGGYTGSFQVSGSAIISGSTSLNGYLQLDPTKDPGTSNLSSSFFFVSSSADNNEFNLHYRNNGALWEMHWLEEQTGTGLVWGGDVTFTGSILDTPPKATEIRISPGAGLIVNYNASTSSHGDTTATYVQFGPITQSLKTDIESSQVVYLLIDENGNLVRQTTVYTPEQFTTKFPLGYIFALTTDNISSYADSRVTTYGQVDQQTQFLRAFGPLKLSGMDITAQPSSLKIDIAAGRAFRHGGFYKQDPQNPSTYDSSVIYTGSLVRVYRDPGVVGGFRAATNAGLPYTDIDPTKYDDGSGTLQTVGASEWTIQRVFQGVVNGISYVYYGQSVYSSLALALGAITTDNFQESPTSILSLPFIGYIVCRGNTTDLSDTNDNRIINSGLFRNTAGASGGGGAAAQALDDLSDVTITGVQNGQALVYNTGLWINGNPATASYVTGSVFTSTNPALSASYALTSSNSLTASYALNAGSSTALTIAEEGNSLGTAEFINFIGLGVTATVSSNTASINIPGGSGEAFPYSGSARITGSLGVTGSIQGDDGLKVLSVTASFVSASSMTGSLFGTASYVTGSIFTDGNLALSASFAVSAAYAPGGAGLSGGQDKYIARWDSTTSITTSSLYEGDNKNIGVNVTAFNVTNPEALRVSGSTINVISGESNIDTYTQLNIVNKSTGTNASSDIVATNNTGNETGNYVDLGINGSNYAAAFVGVANEAYLYNTGSNFLIGNITTGPNANLKLFAGNNATVFPIVVTGSNAIITGSVTGSFKGNLADLTQHLKITGSLIVTGSNGASEFTVVGQSIFSGSVVIESPLPSELDFRVVGGTQITGSLIVSGSNGAGIFSKGATIADLTNTFTITGSYHVWRAPYSASVVALYAFKSGSNNVQVNARRSGSAATQHLATNLTVTNDNQWTSGGTVQNVNYAPGDGLEIIISGSTQYQVSVQVDFIKK